MVYIKRVRAIMLANVVDIHDHSTVVNFVFLDQEVLVVGGFGSSNQSWLIYSYCEV